MDTIMIKENGIEFHFAFDSSSDDPSEGSTLTGVFNSSGRLRPSDFAGEIPYDAADAVLIPSFANTTKLYAAEKIVK